MKRTGMIVGTKEAKNIRTRVGVEIRVVLLRSMVSVQNRIAAVQLAGCDIDLIREKFVTDMKAHREKEGMHHLLATHGHSYAYCMKSQAKKILDSMLEGPTDLPGEFTDLRVIIGKGNWTN